MFYDRLNEACALRGEKLTPIIAELKMSSGNLASWKQGNTPRADTIQKLAKRLNISSDYLLEKTDDPSPPAPTIGDVQIEILARAARKMTPEEKQKLIDMAKVMFKDAFDESK